MERTHLLWGISHFLEVALHHFLWSLAYRRKHKILWEFPYSHKAHLLFFKSQLAHLSGPVSLWSCDSSGPTPGQVWGRSCWQVEDEAPAWEGGSGRQEALQRSSRCLLYLNIASRGGMRHTTHTFLLHTQSWMSSCVMRMIQSKSFGLVQVVSIGYLPVQDVQDWIHSGSSLELLALCNKENKAVWIYWSLTQARSPPPRLKKSDESPVNRCS